MPDEIEDEAAKFGLELLIPKTTKAKVSPKWGTLVEECPEILDEWDYKLNEEEGLYPDKVTAGSIKKAHWICPKGHKYIKVIRDRCVLNKGCSVCYIETMKQWYKKGRKKQAATSKASFGSRYPRAALEWHPTKNRFHAFYVLTTNRDVFWWQCYYNPKHQWQTTIQEYIANRNCPYCGKAREKEWWEKGFVDTRDILALMPLDMRNLLLEIYELKPDDYPSPVDKIRGLENCPDFSLNDALTYLENWELKNLANKLKLTYPKNIRKQGLISMLLENFKA
jgi:hypothetical protein